MIMEQNNNRIHKERERSREKLKHMNSVDRKSPPPKIGGFMSEQRHP